MDEVVRRRATRLRPHNPCSADRPYLPRESVGHLHIVSDVLLAVSLNTLTDFFYQCLRREPSASSILADGGRILYSRHQISRPLPRINAHGRVTQPCLYLVVSGGVCVELSWDPRA